MSEKYARYMIDRLIKTDRAGTSRLGNPRLTLHFKCGLSLLTAPDSAVGYIASNSEYVGQLVRVEMSPKGDVIGIEVEA